MGDADFSFDFERALPTTSQASAPPDLPSHLRKNFRQTVCRHWWRGLCMKGDACGFLHQWDPNRMPMCRFFAKNGECREPNCAFKHSQEEIKDCNMYNLGFCIHGSLCRYRHVKKPGPPPAAELAARTKVPIGGMEMAPGAAEGSAGAGAPQLGYRGGPMASGGYIEYTQPRAGGESAALALPAPAGGGGGEVAGLTGSCRYFLIKSNNHENLQMSVREGIWATHRLNESKLNEARASAANVVLFFSVNESRHFQGCARMESQAGDPSVHKSAQWQSSQGGAGSQGSHFRVRWLRTSDLNFAKTQHLSNAYNENKPVKVGRDCQEVEPGVGAQLMQLLFAEPESQLASLIGLGPQQFGAIGAPAHQQPAYPQQHAGMPAWGGGYAGAAGAVGGVSGGMGGAYASAQAGQHAGMVHARDASSDYQFPTQRQRLQ